MLEKITTSSPAPSAPAARTHEGLGLIVPMRGREWQLGQLLPALGAHFADKQASNIRMVVVEQCAGDAYNKGLSLNVGVDYLRKTWPELRYLCLHDVDLLPGAEADYAYIAKPTFLVKQRVMKQPKDFRSLADETVKKFRLLEDNTLGLPPGEPELPMEPHIDPVAFGVLVCSPQAYVLSNGYSNSFWGWGNEDLDLVSRFFASGNRVQYHGSTFTSNDLGCHLFTLFGQRWCRLNGFGEELQIENMQVKGYWHAPAQVYNQQFVRNAETLLELDRRRISGKVDPRDGIAGVSVAKLKVQEFSTHTHLVFDPHDVIDKLPPQD